MSRILTLNVGASKAVLAEYQLGGKGALTLTAYGSGELPVVDINDPGSLGASLPTILHQIMREKGIRPGPLVVSLSGQMVFPRFAKIPPVGDLEQQVRYEIEQNVPFPVDEIVSDHQFIGETPEGDKATLIVAAKLEGVRAVTDAVRSAGLKPMKVDVSPIAICNALKFAYPQLDGCSVVLDVGSKTTNLIFLEDEKIYNRSIPVAGNTITKEISQQFGCTFEEAEQLKLERGYVALGGVTEDEDEVTDRVSKIIRTVLTRLHAEISRSINFYRSQQGGSAPTRLFLTGGTSRLPQLDQFFTESLQVNVEFLNPFGGLKFGPKIDQAALDTDAFALTESVGLALRGGDAAWLKINLMPPELVNEARALKRIPFLVVGGVAALAALGLGVLTEKHGVDVAQAKLECINQRNGKLSTLKNQLGKEQKEADAALAQADDFQQLLSSRTMTLRRVRAVRKALADGMWIKEWLDVPASKEKPDARDVVKVTVRGWRDVMEKVQASAGGKKTVAEIVQEKIQASEEFAPKSVKVATQGEAAKWLTEFTIEMELAPLPTVQAKNPGKGNGKAGK